MPGPYVYGFGGWKESGKDSAAEALIDAHGFVVGSMSIPIDHDARVLDPIVAFVDGRPVHYAEYIDEVCSGDFTRAKENTELRGFLKRLGADYAREIDLDFWVKRVRASIQASLDASVPYALTGARFENELQMVRDLGGPLVWVERPGIEGPKDTHSTESSVGPDDFDYVVVNDGTLAQLRQKVLDLHQSLGTTAHLPGLG